MSGSPPGSVGYILDALGYGLPRLIMHLVATIVLLVIGIAIYVSVTPFRERELLAEGNPAAGIALGGAVIALAIPLAVLLATSYTLLDLAVWGAVALVLQLITLGVVVALFHGFRDMIRRGNVAAATTLAAAQVAVALLNGAVLVP